MAPPGVVNSNPRVGANHWRGAAGACCCPVLIEVGQDLRSVEGRSEQVSYFGKALG